MSGHFAVLMSVPLLHRIHRASMLDPCSPSKRELENLRAEVSGCKSETRRAGSQISRSSRTPAKATPPKPHKQSPTPADAERNRWAL
jgi:hypothetical protein